jgi:predicted Zn-dependent protease with MMP-like domain
MELSEKRRSLFDSLFEEVIQELPTEFRKMLDEVPVLVDDEPSLELQRELDDYKPDEPSDICGLHSGPSISAPSRNELIASAPLIQLFRGPILRLAGENKNKLKQQIRITLLHELGHHFDFSEEDLEKRGLG